MRNSKRFQMENQNIVQAVYIFLQKQDSVWEERTAANQGFFKPSGFSFSVWNQHKHQITSEVPLLSNMSMNLLLDQSMKAINTSGAEQSMKYVNLGPYCSFDFTQYHYYQKYVHA